MCIVPASAVNGEELTFRGIKFGTEYNEVMEKIMEDIGETRYSTTHPIVANQLIEDVYAVTFGTENLKVAGYNVSIVQLFFACTDDTKTVENSIFVGSEYELQLADKEYDLEKARTIYYTTEEDLSNKLSALYGRCYFVKGIKEDNLFYVKSGGKYYWAEIEEKSQYDNLINHAYCIFQWERYKDFFKSLNDYIYMDTEFYYSKSEESIIKTPKINFTINYRSVAAMRTAEKMRQNNVGAIDKVDTNDFNGL